jgi:hypothetical protein
LRRKDASRSTRRRSSSQRVTSAYAGGDFQSLSAAARELEALRRSGQWGRLLVLAGRRRQALWRGFRAVRRLRDLELPLTATPAGEAIWRTVQSRPARVARAVLQLPDDEREYLRGRSRQALRTNVRHAGELGVACRELPDIADKHAALYRLLRNLGRPETSAELRYLETATGLAAERQQVYAAFDPAGDVVALAVVEVDVRCARLVFLHSVAGRLGAPARYALSLHVINALIDRQVRVLLVGGAVRLAPGLQYFQQRLGFEVFNVRPVPVPYEAGAPEESPIRSRPGPWRSRARTPRFVRPARGALARRAEGP